MSIRTINLLKQVSSLQNKFYALRHGQSEANLAKIISSDPSISVLQHGLSDEGKDQVSKTASDFVKSFDSRGGVAIYSSDFKRARETSEIFASYVQQNDIKLYLDEIQFDTRLRERYFGNWDNGSDSEYSTVWEADKDNADHTKWNVESVNSVLFRTTELVTDIENKLLEETNNDDTTWTCILVAHGDVLQILQTGFNKIDGTKHRTLPHLETATLRCLQLADC